jgi:putative ABC transport system permease protein
MNPWLVVSAGLSRHVASYGLFVLLIAVAVALGVAVSAQEAALRMGSARAADKFDLVVAAPGSPTDATLAAIYLRPGTIPLIDASATARALAEPRVRFAAPLGYGDRFKGSPIVGTIAAFVDHLSGGLAEGRGFAAETEAVVGAAVTAGLGTSFRPQHGMIDDDEDADEAAGAEHHAHEHAVEYRIVGRMRPTGTPWDNAIVVPIEAVWRIHQMPSGHEDGDRPIGPPFEASRVSGVPAIVMRPRSVNDAYGLRNVWRTPATMAFFPAEALTPLYMLMGDIRDILGWFAIGTQALVAIAIMAGLTAILALHRRQFAVLRALGYVFLCIFAQSACLIISGAVLGLLLGSGAALVVSHLFTAQTGIVLPLEIGSSELVMVAGFMLLGLLAALLPAVLLLRKPVIEALSQR